MQVGNNAEEEKKKKENEEESKGVVTIKRRLIASFDLFQFMPVPKTEQVSSRRSLYGSLLMIGCFLAYFIYTLVAFITNNSPTVNQYEEILDAVNVTLPDIAFGYFFGDPFTKTINDPSIFYFEMFQVTKFQDVSKKDVKTQIPLQSCNPDWVPASNFTILCPNVSGNMSGALYQTPEFTYPRVQVNYCSQGGNTSCISQQEIAQIAAGGRILLYVRDNSPNFDLTTGQSVESVPYSTYQYFLMPGLYPRTEIFFQLEKYTIKPDFLRRWQDDVRTFLSTQKINSWITNVSVYNTYNAYQIGFRTELTQQISVLTYQTSFDMISIVGAFWGVLFSTFAAYFLVYNQNTFYRENKQWEDFGKKIGVRKAADVFNLTEEAPHSKVNDSIVFEMTEIHQENNHSQNEQNGV
ncbi:unnamed protein product (macronuclear) [Paramecium tetraurelia]|uniref:ALA-interacting subunit n=1 Tax=Paramecium tetraurelia TaxID=5888 RepID=A0BZD4_PARTE|nr:uncharacterized protein GSPATT00033754001 [Paramecium tetraurelia]CAK63901.1 unnamed protein product [Paramecium tetraurelia]|eukprot:XP_001431299.1 hypothetical protein (macronuclear) [Paramecium tetraurelia strain d4-2]